MNCEGNHLLDVLELIDQMQKNTLDNTNNSCLRPILGQNNNLIFNTRPVIFYLCNNEPLSINFENTGTQTSIFRIEGINGCLVTLRLLSQDDGTLSSTNEFATISINCIAALRCLQDVSLII